MKAPDDVIECARWYIEAGFNPLPSKFVEEHGKVYPPFYYAKARDDGLSERSFEELAERLECDRIQVATGAKWGLVVVDLDGWEAREVWREWTRHQKLPPTWEVEHDPECGKHLWFASNEEVPHKTVLWGGEGHRAIEVLGDRNLIVAPPSVSPRTGRPYRWIDGHSPNDCPLADLPWFVLDAIRRQTPALPAREAVALPRMPLAPLAVGGHCERAEVEKWMDVESVALKLGIRFAAPGWNAVGWRKCYRRFREERHPSASLRHDGLYWEPDLSSKKGRETLNLFDIAIEVGAARDYCHAVDLIGQWSGISPTRRT